MTTMTPLTAHTNGAAPTTTRVPRAVIYLRVSTTGQAEEGTSLDAQKAACLSKARALGAQVVACYEDAGVSGALYAARPGIQAALADLEMGNADTLIVTNAAGGLNEAFQTGDLMLLSDHLNIMGMAGQSPLLGPNDPELGVRFLDMLNAYDPDLRAAAHYAACQHGFSVHEGVYAMVGGPAYETLAEIRFLQRAGADAVGMSTIPEVLVARHERMRVLGISAITDMAVGDKAAHEITHSDILAAAELIKPRLVAVVRGVLASLSGD